MPLGKAPAFRLLFISLVVSAVWFGATENCYSAGDFDVAVDASRTEGGGPAFCVTGMLDLAAGSSVDATFAWNFDTDNLNPAANYRTASRFVAAHVFENTGTSRVRVEVYDTFGFQQPGGQCGQL